MYVWFVYGPQKIFLTTQAQVSGSKTPYTINAEAQVKNKQCFIRSYELYISRLT